FLARLEVRDGDGQTIFSTDDRQVHGVAEAMDILSRMIIKLHSPHRMSPAAATRVSPAEIVSESVMSTDEIGMATIMRLRGRQWHFHMGTFPTTWPAAPASCARPTSFSKSTSNRSKKLSAKPASAVTHCSWQPN
ncbi:MAG TPA: hypothetical protein PKC25_10320, partial [Candidatus Rifleibacterium sp.]|nr:hypothetical protein [Candidatus Rifleibacterium sp.]